MSAGEIAGLLAAVAAVAFVVFCAVPLLKLGRVLEEMCIRDSCCASPGATRGAR